MTQPTVYIVDGKPIAIFSRAQGTGPGPFQASDLAVASAPAPAYAASPFGPEELDEVIVGTVAPGVNETNIARIVALRLGCGHQVPAWTVQRNCASGMQAIDSAFTDLLLGALGNWVLAGGAEAMSHSPVLYKPPHGELAGRHETVQNPHGKKSGSSCNSDLDFSCRFIGAGERP